MEDWTYKTDFIGSPVGLQVAKNDDSKISKKLQYKHVAC